MQDFKTQLQYTINERSGNCSVKKIPMSAPDVEKDEYVVSDNAHLRIKHAKDLLDIEATKFVYAGEVRGTWLSYGYCVRNFYYYGSILFAT